MIGEHNSERQAATSYNSSSNSSGSGSKSNSNNSNIIGPSRGNIRKTSKKWEDAVNFLPQVRSPCCCHRIVMVFLMPFVAVDVAAVLLLLLLSGRLPFWGP